MEKPTTAETCFQALCAIRNLLPYFPETAGRKDAMDAVRIIAGSLGLPALRVKKPQPQTEGVNALYDQIVAHAMTVDESVRKAKLPDRRDWIYQNAFAMLRDGVWAIKPVGHLAKKLDKVDEDAVAPANDDDNVDVTGTTPVTSSAASQVMRKLKLVPKEDPKQLTPVGGKMLPSSNHQPAIGYIINGK